MGSGAVSDVLQHCPPWPGHGRSGLAPHPQTKSCCFLRPKSGSVALAGCCCLLSASPVPTSHLPCSLWVRSEAVHALRPPCLSQACAGLCSPGVLGPPRSICLLGCPCPAGCMRWGGALPTEPWLPAWVPYVVAHCCGVNVGFLSAKPSWCTREPTSDASILV